MLLTFLLFALQIPDDDYYYDDDDDDDGGGGGGDGNYRTIQTFEFNNCGNKGFTKHIGLNFC